MILLGDSLLYTSVLKYYQALLVVCIVPGVSGLFWRMRRPNREQAAALYGIAVFYLASVSDIAMYRDLFGVTHSNEPMTEMAMLVFTAAQTVRQLSVQLPAGTGEEIARQMTLISSKTA